MAVTAAPDAEARIQSGIHTHIREHSAGQSAQLTGLAPTTHRIPWVELSRVDLTCGVIVVLLCFLFFLFLFFGSSRVFSFISFDAPEQWISLLQGEADDKPLRAPGLRGDDKRGAGDNAGRGVALGPTTSFRSQAARGCGVRCLRWDNDDVRLGFSGPPGWDYQSIGSNPEYQNEIRRSHRTDPGWRGWQPGYCGNGAEFGKSTFVPLLLPFTPRLHVCA